MSVLQDPNFAHEVYLILIDKALIGALIAVGGAAFAWYSDRTKAREELAKSVAPARVEAYRELWKISLRPMRDRAARREELEAWYDDGGALFLSLRAAEPFFRLRNGLRDDRMDTDGLRQIASSLRTELKHDCGTYSRREAETKIVSAADAEVGGGGGEPAGAVS